MEIHLNNSFTNFIRKLINLKRRKAKKRTLIKFLKNFCFECLEKREGEREEEVSWEETFLFLTKPKSRLSVNPNREIKHRILI